MNSDTIILGVDFKDNTINLCKEAIRYALKLKSSITLVHAIEYIPYYPYFPHDEKKIDDFFHSDLKWQLDQLESYIKLYNVEVKDAIIEKGKTYEILCDKANKLDAKAIVVGVGKHYLFEELIGSTTEKVSRMAKQKVVIVNNSNGDEIKNVLCALDFSENSLSALASATRFADFFKAKLHVFHAYNTVQDNIEVFDHCSSISDKVINNELDRIKSDFKVDREVIVSKGPAVLEILKAIDKYDIDLLSIGSSGHSNITRLFLGSTVAKIIRKAPCNIVVSPKA